MANVPFGNAFYQALQARLASNPSYSQDYRMSKNSYDCSSLMNRGLQDLGIPGVNPAATTANMNPKNRYMWNLGFQWIPKSQGLQAGDILWRNGHTEFYVGGRRTLGAHGTTNGVSEYEKQGPEKFQGGWRYVGNRFLGGAGSLGNSVQNPEQVVANVAQAIPAQAQASTPQVQQPRTIIMPLPVYAEQQVPQGLMGYSPRAMANARESGQLFQSILGQLAQSNQAQAQMAPQGLWQNVTV